jgi:hypothetical protein
MAIKCPLVFFDCLVLKLSDIPELVFQMMLSRVAADSGAANKQLRRQKTRVALGLTVA